MTTNTKPAATIRDGALKATIWRNSGDKGEFHSVCENADDHIAAIYSLPFKH
jgi:hypothetical protein